MKARPILFSGPMVRALLREVEKPGTGKTQTRRVVKPQPEAGRTLELLKPGEWTSYQRRADMVWENFGYWPCPYGQPGDLLWVRETWCPVEDYTGMDPGIEALAAGHFLAADYPPGDLDDDIERWRPSIFMPRKLSRLTLKLTDIRVQRLQEISEEDAKAEGSDIMWDVMLDAGTFSGPEPCTDYTARDTFRDYINLLNKKRGFGWETNPWMWALTFDVHKINVDEYIAQVVSSCT